MLMFKVAGTLLLLSPAIVNALYLPAAVESGARQGREVTQATIDRIENIAKLLIGIDESVDREIEQQNIHLDHFYMQQPSSGPTVVPVAPTNDQETAAQAGAVVEEDPNQQAQPSEQEEKFSVVLGDLKQVSDTIREGISKANQNRQFRLVLRLRPLLNYVNQIQHNMEMLRTRVVAIATLSNLTESVSEVIDQFGDVMTSSLGLASALIPPAATPANAHPVSSLPHPGHDNHAASSNDKRKVNPMNGAETIRNQHRRPARPQTQTQTQNRRKTQNKPTPVEVVSKSEVVEDTKKADVDVQAVQPSNIQKDSEKIFKTIIQSKPEPAVEKVENKA